MSCTFHCECIQDEVLVLMKESTSLPSTCSKESCSVKATDEKKTSLYARPKGISQHPYQWSRQTLFQGSVIYIAGRNLLPLLLHILDDMVSQNRTSTTFYVLPRRPSQYSRFSSPSNIMKIKRNTVMLRYDFEILSPTRRIICRGVLFWD